MTYYDRRKLRTLIADASELDRRILRSLLEPDGDVEIVGEADSVSEARHEIGLLHPDLLLAEIALADGVASGLMHGSPDIWPYLIVTSNQPGLALRAFELRADDYLLKPLQRQRLEASLRRARQRIAERRYASVALQIAKAASMLNGGESALPLIPAKRYPEQMNIRVRRRMFSVDMSSIIWIQGASQYSRVHTRNGEFLLSRTLASLECELDPARFFRIHRSAIVNAAHVQEVRSRGDGCYNVYLQGGQALPMGRARREILHKLLGEIGSVAIGIQDVRGHGSGRRVGALDSG